MAMSVVEVCTGFYTKEKRLMLMLPPMNDRDIQDTVMSAVNAVNSAYGVHKELRKIGANVRVDCTGYSGTRYNKEFGVKDEHMNAAIRKLQYLLAAVPDDFAERKKKEEETFYIEDISEDELASVGSASKKRKTVWVSASSAQEHKAAEEQLPTKSQPLAKRRSSRAKSSHLLP